MDTDVAFSNSIMFISQVKSNTIAGGKVIQDEMNTYYRDGGGNLPSGLAAVTTAGSLPCKKIIHTIGPEYVHFRYTLSP